MLRCRHAEDSDLAARELGCSKVHGEEKWGQQADRQPACPEAGRSRKHQERNQMRATWIKKALVRGLLQVGRLQGELLGQK